MLNFKSISVLAAILSLGSISFATTPTTSGPTDPQIAHIVVTADKIDIDAGKLAKLRSTSKEVKSFAQMMITDHTSVNNKAVALAKKLKVTPEDNDTSKSLVKSAHENMTNLKKLKGAAFDKAYVDHEVDYHQQVLDAIDNTLIPNAKNTELKGLLEKTRPAIAAHLEHAKQIQTALNK